MIRLPNGKISKESIESIRIRDCVFLKTHCMVTVITDVGHWYTASWALPKPTEEEVRSVVEEEGLKHFTNYYAESENY